LRRYIYTLYARLKLPECIESIESVSRNWSLTCAIWVFPYVNISPRGRRAACRPNAVVSSTRIIIWVFPYVNISRGADVPLAGQTVPAINVFGPNRGTQNTLAAVVGNVNTRSIVLTIHFARHTVK
jgi:hypothetical protein